MIEPYNDDYLVYNELNKHYELTIKAYQDTYGEDLSTVTKNGEQDAIVFLRLISQHTYSKIHESSNNNELQDYILSHTEKGRNIIFRAMLEQALYERTVGNLRNDTNPQKRAMWFSEIAVDILEEYIPEYHGSILYVGGI